jgi:ParB family transcriptional regulator, chromosome partitioning protein
VNKTEIEWIPIAEIRVVNPRSRSKTRFHDIVANIAAIGLKRPITVARRELDPDGTRYDLTCGQGRMEACRLLGETTIPAVVSDASREEQLLMSLVENIARHPPSNRDLIREVKNLRGRNYKAEEIAGKLGLDRAYVYGIIHLVEHSEAALVQAVEGGRLPISVAVEIATGNDHEVQLALSEAYQKGDLRGARLKNAKQIVAQRIARQRKAGKTAQTRRKITGETLVREYKDRIREQRQLVKKANRTKEQLLLLITAIRRLLTDDHFVTLLRAENLSDMPEQLATRIK